MSNTSLIELDTAVGQVPDYMRQAVDFMHDPQAIQGLAIGHVEDILDGKIIVTDPTNPFVTLMGVSAANASAAVLAGIPNLRQRYPVLAATEQELYNHMSDVDYVDRFAKPHIQKVLCLVSLNELKAKMVLQADGSKRAVIQRYANVTVEGVCFTLLYPVVVRELSHGDMSIQYDLSIEHPLQPMASGLIYWTKRGTKKNAETEFLQMELTLVQVRVSVNTYDLNPATGLNVTTTLPDEFCSARVWFKGANMASWQELKTTHSDMVYDASVPTAVLRVAGKKIGVRIPQVYFSSGMVSGKLRVDYYSTKATIFINAEGKGIENFESNWSGEAPETVTMEMAAWHAIPSKFMLFQGVASGGSSALPFETLRANVIKGRTGPRVLPITPSQRNTAMERDGYVLRQFVDTATGRQLLASRALPTSRDPSLITPASATIASVVTTMAALKTSPWVADNGSRLTIVPSALWELSAGVMRLVGGQEMVDLMAQDAETRVATINAGNYMYTPYYYVLDASGDRFNTRAYYLDNPTAQVDRFVGDNDTTGMQIEINAMALILEGNGWQLHVSTLSNAAWKEQDASYKFAQLAFEPEGVGAVAAINGELVTADNGEDSFVFHLQSGFDIDANHKLSHYGFSAITDDPREVFTDLLQRFRMTFATSAPLPPEARSHSMDNYLVGAILPNRIVSVAAQEVVVGFGEHLEHLWTACRSLAPIAPWQTYPSDVPAVEEKDVYEINPATGTDVFFDGNGVAYFNKLASAGDVMVRNGQTVFEHRAGDVVYSGNLPVPVHADAIQRQVDILFLEGCYYFATDASTTQYTKEMIEVMTGFITKDLPTFAQSVLERTDIFFYPKVSLGSVTALIDAGVVSNIQADQSLTVRLGVQPRVFDNLSLRAQLETKTIQTIQAFFDQEVLSISELTNSLRVIYSGDVISIQVTGLGGGNNANAITLVNANERCSLKKRSFILDSGEFTVRENVTVDFYNHTSA